MTIWMAPLKPEPWWRKLWSRWQFYRHRNRWVDLGYIDETGDDDE